MCAPTSHTSVLLPLCSDAREKKSIKYLFYASYSFSSAHCSFTLVNSPLQKHAVMQLKMSAAISDISQQESCRVCFTCE